MRRSSNDVQTRLSRSASPRTRPKSYKKLYAYQLREQILRSRDAGETMFTLARTRIEGQVDLDHEMLPQSIRFDDCSFDPDRPLRLEHAQGGQLVFVQCLGAGLAARGANLSYGLEVRSSEFATYGIDLRNARMGTLDVEHGELGSGKHPCLRLDNVHIEGNAVFTSVRLEGQGAWLPGAHINGELRLSDVAVAGTTPRVVEGTRPKADQPRDLSFFAELLHVQGDVVFDKPFTSRGDVALPGARILGQLICHGARLGTDDAPMDLVVDGMQVKGNVFLDEDFRAQQVHAHGASIGGKLIMTKSTLLNAGHLSLDAPGLTVGDLLLGARKSPKQSKVDREAACVTAGGVNLRAARITGKFDAGQASLGVNGDGVSLTLEAASVKGTVFLNDWFTAKGTVSLTRTFVSEDLHLSDAALLCKDKALRGVGLRVEQKFRWKPSPDVVGSVDLTDASVHWLDDRGGDILRLWPRKIHLNGFRYEGLAEPGDYARRLEWIQRSTRGNESFALQPYEQLSAIYRRGGDERSADRVSAVRQDDLRRSGGLSKRQWLGNVSLGLLMRHGYTPSRVLVLLALLYFACVGVFWLDRDSFVPRMPLAAPEGTKSTECTENYTCFSPWLYSIDVVAPLIKVGQSDAWRPDASQQGGGWDTAYFGAAATLSGWALTTIAVVGFTGLVRSGRAP